MSVWVLHGSNVFHRHNIICIFKPLVPWLLISKIEHSVKRNLPNFCELWRLCNPLLVQSTHSQTLVTGKKNKKTERCICWNEILSRNFLISFVSENFLLKTTYLIPNKSFNLDSQLHLHKPVHIKNFVLDVKSYRMFSIFIDFFVGLIISMLISWPKV